MNQDELRLSMINKYKYRKTQRYKYRKTERKKEKNDLKTEKKERQKDRKGETAWQGKSGGGRSTRIFDLLF